MPPGTNPPERHSFSSAESPRTQTSLLLHRVSPTWRISSPKPIARPPSADEKKRHDRRTKQRPLGVLTKPPHPPYRPFAWFPIATSVRFLSPPSPRTGGIDRVHQPRGSSIHVHTRTTPRQCPGILGPLMDGLGRAVDEHPRRSNSRRRADPVGSVMNLQDVRAS